MAHTVSSKDELKYTVRYATDVENDNVDVRERLRKSVAMACGPSGLHFDQPTDQLFSDGEREPNTCSDVLDASLKSTDYGTVEKDSTKLSKRFISSFVNWPTAVVVKQNTSSCQTAADLFWNVCINKKTMTRTELKFLIDQIFENSIELSSANECATIMVKYGDIKGENEALALTALSTISQKENGALPFKDVQRIMRRFARRSSE